jgi:hypothetical protein
MERQKAVDIGGHLAQAIEASRETQWAIVTALQVFPGEATQNSLSSEKDAIHWLSANVLVTATAGDATAELKARPVNTGSWSLTVTYEAGQLGAVLKHPGLRSRWAFHLPGGETVEVNGEIVFKGGDDPEIDAGEQLARGIAAQMMGSPAP